MKKSLLMLPIALIAMAMALTACGGGSSSSGGGEEAAIEEAIETAATSSDPSKCAEVQTEAFNETETGTTGKGSLAACEKEVEEEAEVPAESVTVSDIKEDGETATAAVEVEGGALGGQGIEVELTKEEGAWKLNGFLGFTNYDAAGIAATLEEKLGEQEGIEPSLAKCVAEGTEEMSQEEVEAMVFEKNEEGLEGILEGCQ